MMCSCSSLLHCLFFIFESAFCSLVFTYSSFSVVCIFHVFLVVFVYFRFCFLVFWVSVFQISLVYFGRVHVFVCVVVLWLDSVIFVVLSLAWSCL